MLLAALFAAPALWAGRDVLHTALVDLPAWPLTTVLLGAWLTLRFHHLSELFLILVPSVTLAAVVLGLGAATSSPPTPLSGLVLALVTALSCRHGADLLDRYLAARARGLEPGEAVHVVWHHAGLATTTGTVAAVVPFCGMALAPNAGLRAAGLLLATGQLASLALHAAVLPALLRVWPGPVAPQSGSRQRYGRSVHYAQWIRSHATVLVWSSVVALLASLWLLAPSARPWLPEAMAPAGGGRAAPGLWTLLVGVGVLWWLLRDLVACGLALLPLLFVACGLAALLPLPGWLPALDPVRFPAALLPILAAPSLAIGLDWALARQTDQPLDRLVASQAERIGYAMGPPLLAMLAVAAADQAGVRTLALHALLGLGLAAVAGLITLPAGLALLEFRRLPSHVAAPGAVTPAGRAESQRDPRRLWAEQPMLQALPHARPAARARQAPATFGALVAMPVAALLSSMELTWRGPIALLLCLATVPLAARYLGDGGRQEQPRVMVDEFSGSLCALVCVPWQPLWVIVVFLAFRAIGVWAPWPVRAAGRLPGAWGLVADDVVAGLLAGLATAALRAAIH